LKKFWVEISCGYSKLMKTKERMQER